MKRQILIILALSAFGGTSFGSPFTSSRAGVSAQRVDSSSDLRRYSDSDLKAIARRSLARDPLLSADAQNIHIKVKKGHATLFGAVNSVEEWDTIREKVQAIEGIRSVDNQLVIQE